MQIIYTTKWSPGMRQRPADESCKANEEQASDEATKEQVDYILSLAGKLGWRVEHELQAYLERNYGVSEARALTRLQMRKLIPEMGKLESAIRWGY